MSRWNRNKNSYFEEPFRFQPSLVMELAFDSSEHSDSFDRISVDAYSVISRLCRLFSTGDAIEFTSFKLFDIYLVEKCKQFVDKFKTKQSSSVDYKNDVDVDNTSVTSFLCNFEHEIEFDLFAIVSLAAKYHDHGSWEMRFMQYKTALETHLGSRTSHRLIVIEWRVFRCLKFHVSTPALNECTNAFHGIGCLIQVLLILIRSQIWLRITWF